jgi:hypothetical protein
MKMQSLYTIAVYFAAVVFCVPFLNAQTTNTSRGFQALFSNTSGTYNTAMGYLALRSNTTGTANSGFGAQTLTLNTTGGQNTAMGRFALYSNTTGGNNTASGAGALYFNNTGRDNTATGVNALYNNRTGILNTAIGSAALYSNTTGYQNWAGGNSALFSNTTGYQNSAGGSGALSSNTTGYRNSAHGSGALGSNTSGHSNTANGYQALFDNTSADFNTANGSSALRNNTTGSQNTAVGAAALFGNTTGIENTALGYQALFLGSTGYQNVAVGNRALFFNTTGGDNTAVGNEALYSNSTGDYNTAMGSVALNNNTSGGSNTAVGGFALSLNTTGHDNSACGLAALNSNTDGSYNSAFGRDALKYVTTGWDNAALGHYAGGTYNTISGTFLGAYSDAIGPVYNSTAVGFEAFVTGANQIRLGNTTVTSIGGQVNWTTFSDGRFKKNVKEEVPGLTFINILRPVVYTLDVTAIDSKMKVKTRPSSGSSEKASAQRQPSAEEQQAKAGKEKMLYTGLVAQEVETAAKKLNYEFSGVDVPQNTEGFYGLRYAEFVVPLIKAVQELSKQNEELKQRITQLEAALFDDAGKTNNGLKKLSGAYLEQNQPNPFNGTTILRYYLPEAATSAKIVITTVNGQLLKSIALNGTGKGQVTLSANTLSNGSYIYSLWVNDQKVDSKQMLLK